MEVLVRASVFVSAPVSITLFGSVSVFNIGFWEGGWSVGGLGYDASAQEVGLGCRGEGEFAFVRWEAVLRC